MSESPDKLEVASNFVDWFLSQTTKWQIIAGVLLTVVVGAVFTSGFWFGRYQYEANIEHIRVEHARQLVTKERELLERKNQEMASLKKRIEYLENRRVVTDIGIE